MNLLEKLKKMESESTPGPWKYDCGNLEIEKEDDRFGICTFDRWLESLQQYGIWNEGKRPDYPCHEMSNAEFICECRNALPKLIDALEIAREALTLITVRCSYPALEAQETLRKIESLLK